MHANGMVMRTPASPLLMPVSARIVSITGPGAAIPSLRLSAAIRTATSSQTGTRYVITARAWISCRYPSW